MTERRIAQALLAPVPEVHLQDGHLLCQEQGRVAFGSRAWQTLRTFDEEAGAGAPVYIYASHSDSNVGPTVTWRAKWVGWVETNGQPHPKGDLVRPPSTLIGGEDTSGYWVGFWEVTSLHPLPRDLWIKTANLIDIHGRRYRKGFIPEGPILLGAEAD